MRAACQADHVNEVGQLSSLKSFCHWLFVNLSDSFGGHLTLRISTTISLSGVFRTVSTTRSPGKRPA